MNLYLVKGRVRTEYYGNEEKEVKEVIRLVRAEDTEEAGDKFTRHFESGTSEYSVYYYADVHEVSEVIE